MNNNTLSYLRAVKEEIDKFIQEDYPKSFDFEYFKTLKSFNARKNYCEEHLQRISSGSGRIIYKIDNEKVLKLAKNKKGVAQNLVEIDQSEERMTEDVVAQTFDHHLDGLWVEAELCTKLTPSKFKNMVGISFNDFSKILYNEHQNTHPRQKYDINIDLDDYWENEFIYKIITYMQDYGLPHGDLRRLSTYGVNPQGDIVIVDYGLTDDVYKQHYHR